MKYLVSVDHNRWRVSPEVIMKVFKKCCMFGAVGETGVMLWNGREEGGDVMSKCEEDDGTYCGDGGSDSDW
jgi:hypothetical protein